MKWIAGLFQRLLRRMARNRDSDEEALRLLMDSNVRPWWSRRSGL